MTRPITHEQAQRSFFADSDADPRAVRVCVGTSCKLSGGEAQERRLEGLAPLRGVYCLGFCHRSPAALHPDGRIECEEESAEEVRCVAREAVVTRRLANGDHSELAAARGAGVYAALVDGAGHTPEALLEIVERSGERGRGGAGFPTGAKWRACAEATGSEKVVVANGDEGDPGSFVDRLLMEHDPHAILEGMALCARAIGASTGIVYVRSEYPRAAACLRKALEQVRAAGILAALPGGFDVRVVTGKGSYVCGEETALLNSLEGRRGEVRLRPPYPTDAGLHGRPTVVNNVETFVNVPWIVGRGAAAYQELGTPATPGTKALCLNRGFARPGVVEVEFGTSLRRVVSEIAGGGRQGTPLDGVILGGPMGSVVLEDQWDLPLDPAALAEHDIELGHGGIVALPRGTDYTVLLQHWLKFMVDESCGKCVPCRLGSRRALELSFRLGDAAARDELAATLDLTRSASLCAFGQNLPVPAARLLSLARGASNGKQR
jgi:NADH:ubiquinone oxidoreductase subunit F (NADH-binding)